MGKNPHEETARAGGKPGYGTPDRGNGTKGTVSTGGNGVQKVSLAASTVSFIKSGNPFGLAWQAIKPRKKTEKEKVAANIKKGYDVSNPAEMHAIKPRIYKGPEGNGGQGIKSLTTAPVTSAVSEPSTGHEWNFQAYNKGDFVKGTKQELSGGKRFGPPPLKGPDPQGLDVLLSTTDYFKDLVK